MSGEQLYKKLAWILFIIFSIGILAYVVSAECVIQGDGVEYILQTIAIQNHYSLDIRPKDVMRAAKEYYNQSTQIENMISHLIGFQVTDLGKVYSNHFGAYAYIVVWVKAVLDIFHIYPLRAFYLTNVLLWMSSIGVILGFLKTSWKKRLWLSVLMMFNPVIYYVDWTHTEVYIFSFLVIGLVCFYNQYYKLAILSISVATMQNAALIPYAVIVGLDWMIEMYKAERVNGSGLKINGYLIKKVVLFGIFYIPAFIPMICSYIHFKTFSVVADIAREKEFLGEKAWGYLFDLNLGIFPFMPIVLILFIIMLIIGLKKSCKDSILNFLGVAGILYIISNQRQINSGMDTIMRYNVWIIPIMAFFVVMRWEMILSGIKYLNMQICIGMEVIFTAFIIAYTIWGGGGYTNGRFAPWTQVVLEKAPQLYNPTHGIFYSRSMGGEQYYSNHPAVYYDKEGYAKKILLNAVSEEEFGENWKLFDKYGVEVEKSIFLTKSRYRNGFKYINFNDDIIAAVCNENVDVVQWAEGENVIPGMYYREGDKCWASGQSSFLLENKLMDKVGMQLDIIPASWIKSYSGEDFILDIYINGKLIKHVSNCTYDSVNHIYINPKELEAVKNKSGTYYVVLKSNVYCTPNPNQDIREFSYMFKYIGVPK